jgi:hypothetical protein
MTLNSFLLFSHETILVCKRNRVSTLCHGTDSRDRLSFNMVRFKEDLVADKKRVKALVSVSLVFSNWCKQSAVFDLFFSLSRLGIFRCTIGTIHWAVVGKRTKSLMLLRAPWSLSQLAARKSARILVRACSLFVPSRVTEENWLMGLLKVAKRLHYLLSLSPPTRSFRQLNWEKFVLQNTCKCKWNKRRSSTSEK